MKNIIRNTIASTLLILFIGVMSVSAQNGPQGKQCPKSAKCKMMKFMELSEEQQAQMKDIRMASQKICKPWADELRETRAHQQTLVTAESPDMKAINKNIDKMSDLMTNIAKEKAKSTQDIRALLSDEQRVKFDQMMQKKKMGHHKGRHNKGNKR
ncbi:Spy/CpxP family protein refolding chaperone [Halosquirtibacter xylanolyticus]|uniref:Spy/CpxP family protein refolding chaperone n=1 Tax=Halosquirtibacter xylanolyticus TaxID=3374599 RepID=UPI00374A802F|nr:Spy/CpxP family protein refolding chaperone [Prolixibacteraceae bacterium]